MSQTTYQVILSTDGKHTVIATSDELTTTKDAMEWAQSTYELLLKTYGRKGERSRKSTDGDVAEAVPSCAVHGVAMVRQQGKYGQFWSCHECNQDGSFCSYRPNER